jgi:protein tyrosine/serine phosphatase
MGKAAVRESSEWRRVVARGVVCVLLGGGLNTILMAGNVPAPEAITNNAAGPRPAEWAQPVQRPGLPNLHKVTNVLYRGAQPTAEGMKELAALGVKTVVNLRAFHSDEDLLKGTGLAYEPIPMKAWHPEREDVLRFLSIVTDTNRQPVFVHCQHGADRTGIMNALYRMVIQGWSREQAIKEMTEGGYGFHPVWINLVKFVHDYDVNAIKQESGLNR